MPNDDNFLGSVLDEAVGVLSKFVVPLYFEDTRGRPIQCGSGFFVASGEATILISAAHVLRESAEKKIFYYIRPDTVCYLSGRLILGRVPEGAVDLVDVAGLLLSEDSAVPNHEMEKFIVDASYIRTNYLPREGKRYVIIGFPASRSSINSAARIVTARAYAYDANSILEQEYSIYGLSPSDHVVIPLDLKVGYDNEGNHRNFPRPQGMSGSPIWVLYEEQLNELCRTFPLVAIGTRYKKREKILIGTDARIILEIINSARQA